MANYTEFNNDDFLKDVSHRLHNEAYIELETLKKSQEVEHFKVHEPNSK